ncbi:MAG: SsrA-binding protein SmpB [Rickettsiales bacterium]|jgi:SsrA-binding protein|nr:SsrA-binding protein SmpB [Rickettsiales bacterium]
MKTTAKKPRLISTGVVSENRRARFSYAISETVEAGLSLTGAEVKSLRQGRASIAEGYAVPDGGGMSINNLTIGRYDSENPFAARTEKRPRRLLLNKSEIRRLVGVYSQKGSTIVPLKLYFNARGIAKLLLGIGTGKKLADKRETIKRREWDREKARVLKVARKK